MMGYFRKDLSFVSNVASFIKPYFVGRRQIVSPLDTMILRVHYKASVGIFLCLFTAITSFWVVDDPMKCVLKFDRSQVIGYLEDICLSYPFTYNASINEFPRKRIYALHYRWVHYALLILVFLYNVPLLLRKHLDRKDINFLLNQSDYLNTQQEQRFNAIENLISFVGRVGFLYGKILLIHFVIILVDVIAFVFLDIVLQNRFARLFPIDYPFTRWPQYFNDTLSKAFPPFAECRIGPEMMILINRDETLGCSLPLMTIYQKCFIFLWLWLVVLTLWSIFVFTYFCCLVHSRCCQRRLIRMVGRRNSIEICLRYLSIGDLIFLNNVRSIITSEEYRDLLNKTRQILEEERERGIYRRPIGWNLNLKQNVLPALSSHSGTASE